MTTTSTERLVLCVSVLECRGNVSSRLAELLAVAVNDNVYLACCCCIASQSLSTVAVNYVGDSSPATVCLSSLVRRI
jgi:hypothetical protein